VSVYQLDDAITALRRSGVVADQEARRAVAIDLSEQTDALSANWMSRFLPQSEGLPDAATDESVWHDRYRSIVDLEKHLHASGTRIIKIFLHVSKEEQRQRLLARINEPDKNWSRAAARAVTYGARARGRSVT
jgi:hypothetical protein